MIQNIAPTKSNLLKIKQDLKLSKVGYNLIDKKRTVLIKEMMQQIEKAKEILIRGFSEEITKALPLEYAMEMNNLINLELKGSLK